MTDDERYASAFGWRATLRTSVHSRFARGRAWRPSWMAERDVADGIPSGFMGEFHIQHARKTMSMTDQLHSPPARHCALATATVMCTSAETAHRTPGRGGHTRHMLLIVQVQLALVLHHSSVITMPLLLSSLKHHHHTQQIIKSSHRQSISGITIVITCS